jgi:hypothetical protein
MGVPGIGMDRGLDDRGLGHTHVSHELGHHHFRGLLRCVAAVRQQLPLAG